MTETENIGVPDEVLGFSQVRLDVDLGTGSIKKSTMSKEFCRDWIGGYGFGAKVLWDEMKPGIDPLGPDNVLVYAHGPFLPLQDSSNVLLDVPDGSASRSLLNPCTLRKT